jgi:hypothetical protein
MEEYEKKRRFPRVPSENSVMITKLSADRVEGFTKTRVVGLGGCMIVSDVPLGVGSLLQIRIAVRGQLVSAVGRVIYETPAAPGELEVGVEFVEIAEPDRQVLQGLLPAPP